MIAKIISGGQTGADQGALLIADRRWMLDTADGRVEKHDALELARAFVDAVGGAT